MSYTRAKKQVETARCCWVCGKLGEAGYTTALRNAGYDVPQGQMGYAHPGCMRRVMHRAAQKGNAK